MTPLHVVAELASPIAMHTPIALDGLLAYARALELRLPPPSVGPIVRIDIPVQEEPQRRFHMCSFSVSSVEWEEKRWINRRFPLAEAQNFGSHKIKRVPISAGPCKSYRIPMPTKRLEDDVMKWWLVGEKAPVEGLLQHIGYLGKKRSVGMGRVSRWRVETCEPWGDGFPVARGGVALRNLPVDWPGLDDPMVAVGNLTYPYWDKTKEEVIVIP